MMNKIKYIFLLLALPVFVFMSCEDMLEVDSDRLVTVDDNYMKSDSLYSVYGVLYQLQKIADSYVILGELRGDLLEASEAYANKYLKEISNFETYSYDNPYTSNKSDYYAIINNCNYVISNSDTLAIYKGEKAMQKTMAAITAIKAWTYMQLVNNFGEAHYFDKPLLSIQDGLKDYPLLDANTLFPKLIAELLPYQNTERLNPGEFGGFDDPSLLCFPVRFVLGDLYLWTGQYENAASAYRDLMYYNRYVVGLQNYLQIAGSGSSMEFTGNYTYHNNFFAGKSGSGYITAIAVSNEYEHFTDLDSFLFSPSYSYSLNSEGEAVMMNPTSLLPTELALQKFDSTLYFHDYKDSRGTTWLTTKGDMRGYRNSSQGLQYTFYAYTKSSGFDADYPYVFKYYRMNHGETSVGEDDEADNSQMILPYRTTLLYLRYAEAVNRLGKPNTALAVLKNGMNRQTLNNRRIIPESEYSTPLPGYMDFTDTRFDSNIGIHARGAGYTNRDTTFYKIDLSHIAEPTKQDSILYVEDLIQKELVLELAYEGTRFHDLMRMSIHRGDNAYLADIVSEKYKDAATRERVRTKLMSQENWYIK
ncbi:RagB/SusD family nutrient uptake outer membrane protein [Bacteroidales bacterium OttesenSCG-928-L03]|nr:RagB/SusD family nutrient uptake outer membrane protein [Bacteroidales bacterium OttesenSCG-928-L03]